MKNRSIVIWLLALCLILLAASTIACAVENATLPRAPTLTHQQIILGGQPLKYNVTAGILPVYDEKGNETARMFYLAYVRDGLKNTESRPVSFFFNGGPGTPSQMVNILAFGPKTVPLGNNSTPIGPPYKLEDNPDTLLNVTDLVFMDPVGTGYSNAVPPSDDKKFWTVDTDIGSMSEFVRVYLRRANRTDSPVFIGGESYGGLRAAGMALKLQSLGIYPLGIILISPAIALDISSTGDFSGDVNSLPAIAATAWYHKKSGARLLNKTLDEVLQEVRTWAQNDYLHALWHGNNLTIEERDAVVKRLADYTGLPEDYIRSNNLRINGFLSKLFEGQRLWISIYDGRITGPEGNDPLFPMTFPALAMAFDTHLRKDLGFQTDRYYSTLSFDVGRDWTYRSKQGRYTYTGEDLASALKGSRYLKVFSASGIYDLAVPYDEVLFELHQMDIPPVIASNVQAKSYPGGHMPYLDKIARKQFISDLRIFYKGALMNWSSAK